LCSVPRIECHPFKRDLAQICDRLSLLNCDEGGGIPACQTTYTNIRVFAFPFGELHGMSPSQCQKMALAA